jgi:pimeloyl-ACP methyl ester carboxylesterase
MHRRGPLGFLTGTYRRPRARGRAAASAVCALLSALTLGALSEGCSDGASGASDATVARDDGAADSGAAAVDASSAEAAVVERDGALADADPADGGAFTAPTQAEYVTGAGSIYLGCQGAGAIPVVLLAGGADAARVWDALVAALGPGVLTCRFNRPGVAPSDPAAAPLTPQVVADLLAETLSQAHVGTRFVIVGHSLGGLVLRAYGATHGASVVGAVFLDPTVPSFGLGAGAAELRRFDYDPEATVREGDAVTHWDADVPVTVLSHDPAVALAGGWTADAQTAWSRGQQVYAALTSRGSQTDVMGASHYIHVDAPTVVAAAIRRLLD